MRSLRTRWCVCELDGRRLSTEGWWRGSPDTVGLARCGCGPACGTPTPGLQADNPGRRAFPSTHHAPSQVLRPFVSAEVAASLHAKAAAARAAGLPPLPEPVERQPGGVQRGRMVLQPSRRLPQRRRCRVAGAQHVGHAPLSSRPCCAPRARRKAAPTGHGARHNCAGHLPASRRCAWHPAAAKRHTCHRCTEHSLPPAGTLPTAALSSWPHPAACPAQTVWRRA